MPVRKAVIPAAGFGTRFLPATRSIPKVMIPVLGQPAIHFAVEEAANAGNRARSVNRVSRSGSGMEIFRADTGVRRGPRAPRK